MADWEYLAYNTIQNKIIKLEKEFANVKVIGNVNYELIPDILGRSTYCLLPSVWAEPFSLLMVESLSCGTPVIAYRVGGNTEIIKNGKNGYLINEINYLSLFKLLNHIINNFSWNEYMKMSHNARLESEKYSLARRNKRLLVILRGR
jgi:glycosyltransferase involved in cell wall biosynthesis